MLNTYHLILILIGSVAWLGHGQDCSWTVDFTYARKDYYDAYLTQTKIEIATFSVNTLQVLSQPKYVPWDRVADFVPSVRPPNIISFKIGYGYLGKDSHFMPCPGTWKWSQKWSTSFNLSKIETLGASMDFAGRAFCEDKGRNWFNISMSQGNITIDATLPVDVECDDFPSPTVKGLDNSSQIWEIGSENQILYHAKGYNNFVNTFSSGGMGIFSGELEITNSSGKFSYPKWVDQKKMLKFNWDEYTIGDQHGNYTRRFKWTPNGKEGSSYKWCVSAAYIEPMCAWCHKSSVWPKNGRLYNYTEILCTQILLQGVTPTKHPSKKNGGITALITILVILVIGGGCVLVYYQRAKIYRMMHKSEYRELL